MLMELREVPDQTSALIKKGIETPANPATLTHPAVDHLVHEGARVLSRVSRHEVEAAFQDPGRERPGRREYPSLRDGKWLR